MSDRPTVVRVAVLAGVQLVCVLVLRNAILYSVTGLQRIDSSFRVGKVDSGVVMNSTQVGKTRPTTAGNRLNLGVWHSFHELVLESPPRDVSRLELDAKLESGAVLTVTYASEGGVDEAVRLSLNPDFPSAFLRVNADGRFVERDPRPFRLQEGWNHVSLKSDSRSILVSVNGADAVSAPSSAALGSKIAFRNGFEPVSISALQAWNPSGERVLNEDFANHQGELRLLAYLCLAAAALDAILLLAARTLRSRRRAILDWTISASLTLLATASVYSWYDFHVYSHRYPYEGFIPFAHDQAPELLAFERVRFGAASTVLRWAGVPPGRPEFVFPASFTEWFRSGTRYSAAIGNPGYEHFPTTKDLAEYAKPGTCRIAVVGTSQTWGAGARAPDQTWVARLYRNLLAKPPCPGQLEVFNLSTSGETSGPILENYRRFWKSLKPFLLIVNLGNNDIPNSGQKDAPQFVGNLEQLASIARAQGTRTVFVREANAWDGGFAERHMKPVSYFAPDSKIASFVPLLDLNTYLSSAQVRDSGFLWWDSVHLTPFGQELAGDWLSASVRELLAPSARPSGGP